MAEGMVSLLRILLKDYGFHRGFTLTLSHSLAPLTLAKESCYLVSSAVKRPRW